MNVEKLWSKISANKDYLKWKEEHDAFEQVAIIKVWCDYEDYDVTELCHNDAREVIVLYCFIQFVLGVEFLATAQEMADDTGCDDFDKEDVQNAQLLLEELNAKA